MTEMTNEVHVSPVTKVARNLTAIVELASSLEEQAIEKANDRLMPGGLAMVALAPVANLNEWSEQLEAAEYRHQSNPDRWAFPSIEDEDDWEPPLQTLRFWSEAWRTHHGMAYGATVSLSSEANFIRWALDWAWDNEQHWDNFAKDVADTRSRLESLLYAGTREERTRVVCDRDQCAGNPPRLIKVHAPRRADSLVCPGCMATYAPDSETHCRVCDKPTALETVWVSNPADDRFKCPSCKTRFALDEFTRAHAKQLRSESAEKYVHLTDAIGTLRAQGRAERTIRKWLEPPVDHTADQCTECGARQAPDEYAACPESTIFGADCGGQLSPIFEGNPEGIVGGYCDIDTHKVWVWWPDLWHLHLVTGTRRRISA